MNEKIVYRCNICYLNKGHFLNSCGCFYCSECLKDSKSYINIEKNTCFSCAKPIDFNKAIDITNKESVRKVEFIYDEPEVYLKRILEMIKFQKLHKAKYIEFLEQKVDQLTKENMRLKENLVNGKPDYANDSSTINKKSLGKMNNCIMPNSIESSNQFLDLKQIKKIEPKKLEKNSNKVNPNKNLNDYIKIDNLNAKTVEIMKSSPAINNKFNQSLIQNNQQFPIQANQNSRSLLNININNSNKLIKEEMSNHERYLFKQNIPDIHIQEVKVKEIEQPNFNYQNQKRKHFMTNMKVNNEYSNTVSISHDNQNFQTPVPNNNHYSNLQITKKFKYY